MRVVVLGGAVVIAVAAFVVELPWGVVSPGTLVPASRAVEVDLAPDYLAASRRGDPSVNGAYFTVADRERAPLASLVAAILSPALVVPARADDAATLHPLVAAAMGGIGVVPRHADPSDLPVTVELREGVSPHGLGLALHAFDVGTPQDLAAGRRVLGVGTVTRRGALVCDHPVEPAVRAAAAAAVDVVVVPSACARAAIDAVPAGAPMDVLDARALTTAVQLLLR